MTFTQYIPTRTIPVEIELISKSGNKIIIKGNKVTRLYKRRSEAISKQKNNEKIFYDAFKNMWYNVDFKNENAKEQQEAEMKKYLDSRKKFAEGEKQE